MSPPEPRPPEPRPSRPRAPRRNTLLRIAEPLLWLGLALFVLARFGPQIEAWTGIGPGSSQERTLPAEIALATLDGGKLGGDELDGRVRVFTFWATWCRVCRVELPSVQRLHEEWAGSDEVSVVGLSIDRTGIGAVREHVRDRGLTFPQALATPDLRRALGADRAVPTTVIADADGRIRHVLVGVSGPGTLQRAVRRLVDRGVGAGLLQ